MTTIYRKLFGLSPREASFERRGIPALRSPNRGRLETICETFIAGYNAALESEDPTAALEAVETERRGFAYEGAGMALMILDLVLPWSGGRVERFLAGPGAPHAYMVHVGAGWALARLRRSPKRYLPRFSPKTRWLMLDGYGFHEGFFAWKRYIGERQLPPRLTGYELRAFDQGLGRSLWFVTGAEVEPAVEAVHRFPLHRQPDVWSGVGLATAYAGGSSQKELTTLLRAAGEHAPAVYQGAAFAAAARYRAGNMAPQTELACQTYAGLPAEKVATLTEAIGDTLPPDGDVPLYEAWRRRTQHQFKEEIGA